MALDLLLQLWFRVWRISEIHQNEDVSPQVISLASDRCVLASAITNSDQSGDISDATVPFWPIRRQSENSNILITKTRSMGACYCSLYELSSRERS